MGGVWSDERQHLGELALVTVAWGPEVLRDGAHEAHRRVRQRLGLLGHVADLPRCHRAPLGHRLAIRVALALVAAAMHLLELGHHRQVQHRLLRHGRHLNHGALEGVDALHRRLVSVRHRRELCGCRLPVVPRHDLVRRRPRREVSALGTTLAVVEGRKNHRQLRGLDGGFRRGQVHPRLVCVGDRCHDFPPDSLLGLRLVLLGLVVLKCRQGWLVGFAWRQETVGGLRVLLALYLLGPRALGCRAGGRDDIAAERLGARFHRLFDLLIVARRGRRDLQDDERHRGAEPRERRDSGVEAAAPQCVEDRGGHAPRRFAHGPLRRPLHAAQAGRVRRGGRAPLLVEEYGDRAPRASAEPLLQAEPLPHTLEGHAFRGVSELVQRIHLEHLRRPRARLRRGHTV
mmetsp:Transcript_102957/g.296490  ORF Transcript_102957/g.296490 Transcript_102957/m.296490 type:complete len:401 (+) Transcript_102957:479-1681(+)